MTPCAKYLIIMNVSEDLNFLIMRENDKIITCTILMDLLFENKKELLLILITFNVIILSLCESSPYEGFIFHILSLQPAEQDDLLHRGSQPTPGHQVLDPLLRAEVHLVSHTDDDVPGMIHEGVSTVYLDNNYYFYPPF